MGMSADFETAVAFGATHVRVGSQIFGRRPPPVSPGRSRRAWTCVGMRASRDPGRVGNPRHAQLFPARAAR